MKRHIFFTLPLTMTLSVFSSLAMAQQDELDITIRVLSEGEQPAGFINRIQLPSFESQTVSQQLEVESNTVFDLVDESTDNVNTTIIDNISIGGATPNTTLPQIQVPLEVVDVLDKDLPLNTDLTDAVDETTGEIIDVIDSALDDDIVDVVGDITDTDVDVIGDVSGEVGSGVTDTGDDISDVTDTVNDINPGDVIDEGSIINEQLADDLTQEGSDSTTLAEDATSAIEDGISADTDLTEVIPAGI